MIKIFLHYFVPSRHLKPTFRKELCNQNADYKSLFKLTCKLSVNVIYLLLFFIDTSTPVIFHCL